MTGEQWPAAAGDATTWQERTPIGSREAVRCRPAPLWGRQVLVAEIDGESRVWCPCCGRFRTLEELGKPYNGHPVGVQTPSGTIVAAEPGDDGPMPARPAFVDLMREPW